MVLGLFSMYKDEMVCKKVARELIFFDRQRN